MKKMLKEKFSRYSSFIDLIQPEVFQAVDIAALENVFSKDPLIMPICI
jgi:hypothetical protein